MSYNSPRKNMKRRWSVKYKRSINCSSPKGFSQKNYCKRKKRGGKYLENTDFKNWLLLNENIEANFDDWAKAIIKYEKPREETILRSLGLYVAEYPKDYSLSLGTDKDGKPILADPVGSIVFAFNTRYKEYKEIIIKVLKNKHLENLNWLSFSIGYLAAKYFKEEDLDLAIDVTKRRIDSGELPKSEIGSKGWMVIGNEAINHVREYLSQQQELSNRQKMKLKKSGETLEEDKNLIQLVASENDLKLYLLPRLNVDLKSVEKTFNALNDDKSKIESRKRLLCKYGKGTDWCTANPSGEYDRYYINNDIYVVHENDVPKYQFTGCDGMRAGFGSTNHQFMDARDDYVREITFELKIFLDKYAKTDISCYDFKIIFQNLKSYQNASKELKEKISGFSLLNIVEDKDFKNLSKEDVKSLFSDVDPMFMTSKTFFSFLEKLPDNYVDFFSDKKIILIIKKTQWLLNGYKVLDEKLSNERLENIFNKNSKNIVIRNLLEDSHSLQSSYILLNFILKKSTINKDNAYTILDTMINKMINSNKAGFVHEDKTNKELDNFAEIFKKENIDKIDLDDIESRLNLKLIVDNKIKSYSLAELKGDVYIYLMIKFLKKYHKQSK